MTFNTSDNANVMIMAVQKAAYGIDLSSASRVYFVSPVWQAAMEQQAIKRAHRIGQTKPVYVETLVIRNSIEDALLKRRNVIAAAHQDQSKTDFYSDKRLQNILNHANIVPRPDHIQLSSDGISFHQPMSFLNKPIWLTPPVPTPPSSPISTTKTKSSPNLYAVSKLKEEMDLDVTSGTDSPRKRQKVVSFTLS
ncbi:P-loop containing nucleoside triphosphate hydrolase protein [Halteromyces radiatus]|uniref:P-loop containing nucleoside triphosphate hydrolase protein n=1 Tax=Halteromyces radiatus TaxID=101107 RepID=UPI00221E7FC7|nr:P-loop containing nucleoside triphosphate hydrolase protein [Halteromyces radiatus]KAI8093001.1 P-loop containing nucleoside triphosphate hydrolase protein [Halteromyces radiatus]